MSTLRHGLLLTGGEDLQSVSVVGAGGSIAGDTAIFVRVTMKSATGGGVTGGTSSSLCVASKTCSGGAVAGGSASGVTWSPAGQLLEVTMAGGAIAGRNLYDDRTYPFWDEPTYGSWDGTKWLSGTYEDAPLLLLSVDYFGPEWFVGYYPDYMRITFSGPDVISGALAIYYDGEEIPFSDVSSGQVIPLIHNKPEDESEIFFIRLSATEAFSVTKIEFGFISDHKFIRASAGSGGALGGGIASVKCLPVGKTMTGGAVAGGIVVGLYARSFSPTGGGVSGGTDVVPLRFFVYTGIGGTVAGATAGLTSHKKETGSGGGIVGGLSAYARIVDIVSIGGALAGGQATLRNTIIGLGIPHWHVNAPHNPVWAFVEQPNKWGYLNNPEWSHTDDRTTYDTNPEDEPIVWPFTPLGK